MKKQKSKTIHVNLQPGKAKGNMKHEVEMPSTGHRDERTGQVVRTASAAHALQTAFKTAKDPQQNSGQSAFLGVPSDTLKADHGTDRQMLYKGKKKK